MERESDSQGELRIAAVTGGTGAIGQAIAERIAATPGYGVVLVARNREKAERAAAEIVRATGNRQVLWEIADLSREAEIRALADRWEGPLHVLVNNAAVTPRTREETLEGIELQFATNVLGYYRMIEAFADRLSASADRLAAPSAQSPATPSAQPLATPSAPLLSRIVVVASYWAGGLDLSDPEFRSRRYENGSAYRASKQADRMLAAYYAERLSERGVTVNACHPGDVRSAVSRGLGFGGHESPEQGARTPVWLAVDPGLEGVTGKYFEHLKEARCPFMEDRQAVERLVEYCRSRTHGTPGAGR